MNIFKLLDFIQSGKANDILKKIYGEKPGTIQQQINRYASLINTFIKLYPDKSDIELFSAPGRTEIGGNHTDHNGGRVLAGAINLDVIAAVSKNETGIITVQSEGYPKDIVKIRELSPRPEEKYSSTAMIRGICARLKELGYIIGGFDAYTTSNVIKGSGLSSSAAFEMLIVIILNQLYNNKKIDAVLAAQIAQYSENRYFGKPCGLMDQTTSAVGGLITIDFKTFEKPIVKKVDYNFTTNGYSIVIVDTGGNHSDLNDDYAAIENEMKDVAKALGGKVLREFSIQKVFENINFLRTTVNDRAILRAIHFYSDDNRVIKQVNALQENNFNKFLNLIIESGYSSWMLCQNCYSIKNFKKQCISIGLALSEYLLINKGAWRVHGGGFEGTIQAFVPNDLVKVYLDKMMGMFGDNSCYELVLRIPGAIKLELK